MNEQAIVEKIISDAEESANAIIADAERRAQKTVEAANSLADKRKQEEREIAAARANSVFEVKAATARLDSAKILLGEKRKVIDEIYARALKQLLDMGKAQSLHLFEVLVGEYAEEGDEVVFAENFRYVAEAAKSDIVKEKKLKVSPKKAAIDGGFLLLGKSSDKNLSYGALLAADREEHQAEIAASVFAAE